MRSNFDKQLVILKNQLTEMATLIENSIDCAATALIIAGTEKAHKAIEYHSGIDEMEKSIEALCLQILLQQQPVAKDLRIVSAALKMITDMQRIGDQARDISEILLDAPHPIRIDAAGGISNMATATIKMVHDVVDAFVKNDMDIAKKVITYDDIIDDMYIKTRAELIEVIRADQENVNMAVDLLSIAKYFEKIGDHAVNIAQWVIFSITGLHKI
ncbi:MAG: phosphate signaling complex protein PhoU [Oscillospiraceae bacterium]